MTKQVHSARTTVVKTPNGQEREPTMRNGEKWVVIDTETTGLKNPVYPVEIAAQTMVGWEPSGPPFRVLLNFDVPIERMAEKIHGYSREYLRERGARPEDGLRSFLQYADSLPIAAYNLSFDLGRVLYPTLDRIGWNPPAVPSLCALNLTRRVVPQLPNFKLKTVIKTLGIGQDQSHRASDDVGLVVSLLSRHLGPHLTNASVIGFDSVVACSDGRRDIPPLEFAPPAKKRRTKKVTRDPETLFAMGELVGICRMIVMDRRFTADKVNFLADWLERCPSAGVQPISGLFNLVQSIVADRVVTRDEQRQLNDAIEQVLAWSPTM